MCEACLLDLMYCKEVEAPDHLWGFQFFIRCPFCNYIHQVDDIAADFFARYVDIQYHTQMSNGSMVQDTVYVRERHTRYPLGAREREERRKGLRRSGET